jgi:hypothetical protein
MEPQGSAEPCLRNTTNAQKEDLMQFYESEGF